MRQRPSYAQHRQTKAQNRTAFTMWLVGCTDAALLRDPQGIAHSYGIPIADATAQIGSEMRKRGIVRDD